ncbi:ParB/RepB/Spo0J family partition protein [Lactococcus nasutitermitis]|uniref:ParB/RepB/Spo0J family partition protein n=1 Tax=Lactococcus nasutitermitis TaxID=1652957 RepID=A0ABV9JAE8_9LACT|nr:ParB/RepB/Spo0J family partition protein [Lactococcus nasutitermitis]
MTEKIVELKISDIVKNPYQPRLAFDEKKLAELANSIQENGVLQPIIVRKSALVGYELLAGERRFLASQIAKQSTIPAIIRDYSDEKMMTLSILENLQREDLNTVEEARSLSLLTEKLGLTHDEVAQSLGKSRSYVSNLLRILDLPESILQQVSTGKISLAHGRTLLAEKNKIRQKNLAARITTDNLSVRQLEDLIYKKSSKQNKASKIDKNIFIEEREHELIKILGKSVKIKANKQYQGTLSVSFDSLDELEELTKLLKKYHQD